MNQARTTYQSDYSFHGWFENNFMSDVKNFCSSDNIDDCLKFISQEFSALGYPSIYSTSSDCSFRINCDIVKLLNAVFDLLRICNALSQKKENLEDRNKSLSCDLNVLHRKNSQIKNSLEQQERKLATVLEKERQLRERNEQLTQLLKNEKEETKRLTAQINKQKLSYQHDLRKYENNLNYFKNKLNQLLSDKVSNKKIATMSMSHPLHRNTGQRGKWKTSTSVTSAAEDMYNTVLSNFEIRTKETYKEVLSYRHYLQSVLLQMVDVLTLIQVNEDNTDGTSLSEELAMSFLNNECRSITAFDEKFTHLFSVLKKNIECKLSCKNSDLENEIVTLKSKLLEYEIRVSDSAESGKDCDVFKSSIVSKETVGKPSCNQNSTDGKKLLRVKSLENIEKLDCDVSKSRTVSTEKIGKPSCEQNSTDGKKLLHVKSLENIEKLDCDVSKSRTVSMQKMGKPSCEQNSTDGKKLLHVKSLENIEKLLSEMSAQKLDLFRLKMQKPHSPTYQGLNTLPSMSVITSRDGSTRLSSLNRLKVCSSSPDHFTQSQTCWSRGQSSENYAQPSKSDSFLVHNKADDEVFLPSLKTGDVHFPTSDLPSWAMSETSNFDIVDSVSKSSETSHIIATNETEFVPEPSSEDNFLRLHAAMQDIEKKKSSM